MDNSRTINESHIVKNDRPHENIDSQSVWKDFLALIKVGIVNSNLITTFTGLWLALHFSGKGFINHLDIVFFTIIGSSLIIAGSCSINNYYDRDIDHLMSRTKTRPTVTGRVNPIYALWLGLVLIAIGIIFLLLTTLTATIIGIIGVFSYVVLYTMWSKRAFTLNTVIGSISGAVPPLIGWAAIEPNLHVVAWVLFLIMFIWQPPHFLALAMKRVDEYRAAGIPMLPVVHGFEVTKRQIVIWVACLLPLPLFMYSLGLPFLVLAILLSLGWLILGVAGYKMKDDLKWAKLMFVYSLNYMTILFVSMIVVTIG